MSQIIHAVPIDFEAVDLDWMIGRSITTVTWHDPLPWSFSFSEQGCLSVESLWRITDRDRVLRTSEDHGHQFGLPAPVDSAQEATDLLSDVQIVTAKLRKPTADLQLEFSSGLSLEILAMYSGYEAWLINGPSGVCYVAQGGRISTWHQ